MYCWSLVVISGRLHYFLYNITGRLQWSLAGVARIDLMSDKYITVDVQTVADPRFPVGGADPIVGC